MKEFIKFGIASKDFTTKKEAINYTYTTKDGEWLPTNFLVKENPYIKEIKNAKNVLEIGCGPGRNFPFFMENTNCNYYGIDPNECMIKYFWECQDNKYKDRAYVTNHFDETIKNIKFDLVVSTFVFQHIGYMPDNYINSINTMNVTDITRQIKKYTNNNCIWILFEHNMEDDWIKRWFRENNIIPDVYIENYTGFESMNDRGDYHNLIIFKENK